MNGNGRKRRKKNIKTLLKKNRRTEEKRKERKSMEKRLEDSMEMIRGTVEEADIRNRRKRREI